MINDIDTLLDIIDTYDVDNLNIDDLIILDEKLEQLRRHIALLLTRIYIRLQYH